MHIADSVFLVTGAGSGLGLATARELIGQGARVVLLDINAETGHAAAETLGGGALFVQADICRADLLVEVEAHAMVPGALA